ncbi:M56 family metallopeptidase [Brytella acorum]|uniref:M56 family metallopeptidase n=1 Tax=Brytella acorum TaxID=2959299 RepID=A0AA35VDF7_9PROT|nr:M56 family metallopeptidase [Brytella acorum]MDF3626047.1 M56 family metallopeptidase [Brytella acorum]CAI9122148.1 M56 family metallopeptidase [Brytella acorum]
MTTFAFHLIAISVQCGVLVLLAAALSRAMRLTSAQSAGLWLAVIALSLAALLMGRIPLHLPSSDPLFRKSMTSEITSLTTAPRHATTRSGSWHENGGAVSHWPLVNWASVLLALWGSGIVAQLALAFLRLVRMRRIAADARPVADFQRRAEALFARHGLSRAPRVLVGPHVTTPLVAGLRRPAIYLPRGADLSSIELDLVLGHEMAHIARRDLLSGLVASCGQVVFWFHPAIRYAVRMYHDAREMACDARVLQRQTTTPFRYGALLLRLGVDAPSHGGIAVTSRRYRTMRRRLEGLKTAGAVRGGRYRLILMLPLLLVGLPWRPVASAQAPVSSVAPQTTKRPLFSYCVYDYSGMDRHDQYEMSYSAGLPSDEEQKLQKAHQSAFWILHDGRNYLFTDPETVARARAILAPQEKLYQAHGRLEGSYWQVHGPRTGNESRLSALRAYRQSLESSNLPADVKAREYARVDTDMKDIMTRLSDTAQADRQARETLDAAMAAAEAREATSTGELWALAQDAYARHLGQSW